MKKWIALLMTIVLGVSAAAYPVFAEETDETPDQITSATTQAEKSGTRNRRQKTGSEEAPQAPDSAEDGRESESTEDGLAAQDGQKSKNAVHGKSSRSLKQGKRSAGQGTEGTESTGTQTEKTGKQGAGAAGLRIKKSGKSIDLDTLLSDQVITQEVYDAIIKYLEEHVSQETKTDV